MKNRFTCLVFLLLLLSIFPCPPVQAAPTVVLNGQQLSFDVPPTTIDGRTMVPMSNIFRALGAKVTWDGFTSTVTAVKGDINIRLEIGNNTALKNDQEIHLDVAPQIIEGRTLVPLAFVSEAMGADVHWEADTSTITITSRGVLNVESTGATYDSSEIYDLCNPAVVSIKTYDQLGNELYFGSGFIITSSGKLITSYRVIARAYSATAKLASGKMCNIQKVLNYDVDQNLAVLQLEGDDFPSIALGNSDTVNNGDKIVAFGSPLGLDNTITDGVVSSSSKTIKSMQYLEFTAPISEGSSGGALINNQAQVVGITAWGVDRTSDSNYAIPVNKLNNILKSEQNFTLASVAKAQSMAAPSVQILSFSFGEAIDEKTQTPVKPVVKFSPFVNQIYCSVKFYGPSSDTILGRWYWSDGKEKFLVSSEVIPLNQESSALFKLDRGGFPFNFGTWQLEVNVGNSSKSGNFIISKENIIEFEREPDDTMNQAKDLAMDKYTVGSFFGMEDDYYKVKIDKNGTLYFTCYGIGDPLHDIDIATLDLSIRLLDSNGNNLATGVRDKDVEMIKYQVAPGTYYLLVKSLKRPIYSIEYYFASGTFKPGSDQEK